LEVGWALLPAGIYLYVDGGRDIDNARKALAHVSLAPYATPTGGGALLR
jgi:hypothetical protein